METRRSGGSAPRWIKKTSDPTPYYERQHSSAQANKSEVEMVVDTRLPASKRQAGSRKGSKQLTDYKSNLTPIPTNARTQKAFSKRTPAFQRQAWQIQKDALLSKFGPSGWLPRKRLSPDALEGIRALHAQLPEKYTTSFLADHFKVSAEAIRRILKSKWRASEEEEEKRRRRWDKRGENIWTKMVELGIKPPKKWRQVSSEHDLVSSCCTLIHYDILL